MEKITAMKANLRELLWRLEEIKMNADCGVRIWEGELNLEFKERDNQPKPINASAGLELRSALNNASDYVFELEREIGVIEKMYQVQEQVQEKKQVPRRDRQE